jgi:hypothetical protein
MANQNGPLQQKKIELWDACTINEYEFARRYGH